ncbi:DUF2306 domain-containing protein [Maricaulis maris]|uniref:Putative membrane protein DUF2306 n=1 Tax=Maricaulis maris TaxID=74318 RepID=A0A495DND7_9PROT|nr:DUF2306 domain-containing protein [Maricaulis maris]RKR03771.1 putative membrane protein DUF2306 [Maricaulis maris]
MGFICQRPGTALLGLAAVAVCVGSLAYFSAPVGDYPFDEQNRAYAGLHDVLVVHIAAGMTALLAGPIQLLVCMQARLRALHRLVGVTFAGAAVLCAVCGLILAGHAFGGGPNNAAFSALAVLLLVTTVMGVGKILIRDPAGHRIWMLRAYALIFSAVTLRAETAVLVAGFQLDFPTAYGIAAWTCWVGNLVVTEWLILARGARRS